VPPVISVRQDASDLSASELALRPQSQWAHDHCESGSNTCFWTSITCVLFDAKLRILLKSLYDISKETTHGHEKNSNIITYAAILNTFLWREIIETLVIGVFTSTVLLIRCCLVCWSTSVKASLPTYSSQVHKHCLSGHSRVAVLWCAMKDGHQHHTDDHQHTSHNTRP